MMHESMVFGSGVLAGACAVLLAVRGRCVHRAHNEHDNGDGEDRVSESTPLVMYSSAGELWAEVAQRPLYLCPPATTGGAAGLEEAERRERAAQAVATPRPEWADLDARGWESNPRRTRDLHRPAQSGEVLPWRRGRGVEGDRRR